MKSVFFEKAMIEKKLLSWSSVGILIFVSAFLWAPSRDGLQGVYCLAFFLPMLLVLLSRAPKFAEYGGWITLSALMYAGFSALSALWSGQPKGVGFFALQWGVLAVWLCGASLIAAKLNVDLQKYLSQFVVLGCLCVVATLAYYYGFVFGHSSREFRMYGWNVFRNANEIGAMCGLFALLSLTIALQSKRLLHASFFYGLAVVAFLGLMASFSRAALMAFVIMSLVALLAIRPPLRVWLYFLGLSVLTGSMLLIFTSVSVGFEGRSIAIDERFSVWKEVLAHSYNNIFAGVGMQENTNITVADGKVFNHAHNAWLDTFYRTGLIGLALVLWNLFSVIKTIPHNFKLLPLYLWLGFGCVCSLFDSRCFFWEIGAKWFFYWIPVGLIAASVTAIAFRTQRAELEK